MVESVFIKIKNKSVILEFARYLVVGGLSYILDSCILFIFKEFVLPDWNGAGLLLATAIGFCAGLLLNYFLSLHFVFSSAKHENKGRTLKEFILFTIVGVVGLLLTELGMYLGADVLNFYYMFIKIIITAVVLIWNYTARKILIFK